MYEGKFRGKRKCNGEWVVGNLITINGQCWIVKVLKYRENLSKADLDVCLYEVIPETVGQYTGRKDKNDKEIYQGDILKKEINGISYYYVVDFGEYPHPASFVLILKKPYQVWELKSTDHLEKVGNIHDNPGLI